MSACERSRVKLDVHPPPILAPSLTPPLIGCRVRKLTARARTASATPTSSGGASATAKTQCGVKFERRLTNLNIRVFRRRRFRSGPSNQGGFGIHPLRGAVHVRTKGPGQQTSPAAGMDRTGPALRRRRVAPGAARARTCSDYRHRAKSRHPGLHGCRTQHRAVGSAPLHEQMSS
jgi:hypothetical protein